MYCSQCGAPAMAEAKFCSKCGAALVSPITENSPKETKKPEVDSQTLVQPSFRDSSKLTKWLKIFLYTSIVINTIALLSGILEYQLLSDFKEGVYSSVPLAEAAAEANDTRQQAVGIMQLSVFLVTAILFLNWILWSSRGMKLGEIHMRDRTPLSFSHSGTLSLRKFACG